MAYVGPAWSEWQEGSEPQVTLCDLYMGCLLGAFASRALRDQIVHLQGALIHPMEELLPAATYPRALSGMVQEESYAFATIDQKEEWPRVTDRSFHRFKLSWGTPQGLNTLVCQGGNIVACAFETQLRNVGMVCSLGALPPEGDREKCRELAFYLNLEAARSYFSRRYSCHHFSSGGRNCDQKRSHNPQADLSDGRGSRGLCWPHHARHISDLLKSL